MNALAYEHDIDLPSNDVVELFEIAHQMKVASLPNHFIADAVKTALKHEGVADLLKLWRDENDQNERDEIVADIQELIDDCQRKNKAEFFHVKMNDLDAISKDIRAFKDSLLDVVTQKGGISHLAELTGIPQPSLSRFFNSNAMPRRTTLLKIARALKLDSVEINTPWAR